MYKILKKHSSSRVKGFTLIELVIVIILLGVLATLATPKFINLKTDAKNKSLSTFQASMELAVAMVYSKSVIEGKEKKPASTVNYIDINNSSLSIKFGAPLSNYGSSSQGSWDDLIVIDYSVYSVFTTGGFFIIYFTEDPTPTDHKSDCTVYYQLKDQENTPPVIKMHECL